MKPDFLKECMSDVGIVPINDFNKNYCMRCVNSQCSRSATNNHLFVKRVTNWEENLFKGVKRADENDPKYAQIRSQKFMPVIQNLGSITINKEESAPDPIFNEEETAVLIDEHELPEVIDVKEEEELTPPFTAPTPDSIESAPQPPINLPPNIVRNTPFQQGIMLDDGKKQEIIPIGGTIILDDD